MRHSTDTIFLYRAAVECWVSEVHCLLHLHMNRTMGTLPSQALS